MMKVRYTIRLQSETQYRMDHDAAKMSFRRGRDFMPFLGLCQFASITIYVMGLADLERAARREQDTLSGRGLEHNIERTTRL